MPRAIPWEGHERQCGRHRHERQRHELYGRGPAPIHLNITAKQGPGNLLGNLLCGVTNLLNNNGPLTQIAGLLNNFLRAL